jgi:hypothetical protein
LHPGAGPTNCWGEIAPELTDEDFRAPLDAQARETA